MNKVVHFEIPFDDKARAMKFYTQAFGWQLTDLADMGYVMAGTVAVNEHHMPKEPGAINGGMMQRPHDAPSVTIYVGVADVDAALAKVKAAGGRVVTPNTPIPGMGSYGRIADTEGNLIGLFAPPAAPPPAAKSASRPAKRAAAKAGKKKAAKPRGKRRR